MENESSPSHIVSGTWESSAIFVYTCMRRLEKKYSLPVDATLVSLQFMPEQLLKDVQEIQRCVLPHIHLADCIGREPEIGIAPSIQLMERLLKLLSAIRVRLECLPKTLCLADSSHPDFCLALQQIEVQQEIILFRKRFLSVHKKVSDSIQALAAQAAKRRSSGTVQPTDEFIYLGRNIRALFGLIQRLRHTTAKSTWLSREIATVTMQEAQRGENGLREWLSVCREYLSTEWEEARAHVQLLSKQINEGATLPIQIIAENLLRLDVIRAQIFDFADLLEQECQAFLPQLEKEFKTDNPRFRTVIQSFQRVCKTLGDARELARGTCYLAAKHQTVVSYWRNQCLEQICTSLNAEHPVARTLKEQVTYVSLQLKPIQTELYFERDEEDTKSVIVDSKRRLIPLYHLEKYSNSLAQYPELRKQVGKQLRRASKYLQQVESNYASFREKSASLDYNFFIYSIPEICQHIREDRVAITPRMQAMQQQAESFCQVQELCEELSSVHSRFGQVLLQAVQLEKNTAEKVLGFEPSLLSGLLEYSAELVRGCSGIEELPAEFSTKENLIKLQIDTVNKIHNVVNYLMQLVGSRFSAEFMEVKVRSKAAHQRLGEKYRLGDYHILRESCLTVQHLVPKLQSMQEAVKNGLPVLCKHTENYEACLSKYTECSDGVTTLSSTLLKVVKQIILRAKTLEGYLRLIEQEMQQSVTEFERWGVTAIGAVWRSQADKLTAIKEISEKIDAIEKTLYPCKFLQEVVDEQEYLQFFVSPYVRIQGWIWDIDRQMQFSIHHKPSSILIKEISKAQRRAQELLEAMQNRIGEARWNLFEELVFEKRTACWVENGRRRRYKGIFSLDSFLKNGLIS